MAFFKASRVPVEYDECSGRPSASKTTENVEKTHNSSMKTFTKQTMIL
jgi:hypothetical protein